MRERRIHVFYKARYCLTACLFLIALVLVISLLPMAYAEAIGLEPWTTDSFTVMVLLLLWLGISIVPLVTVWVSSKPGDGNDLPALLTVLGLLLPVFSEQWASGLLYEYGWSSILLVVVGPVLLWYRSTVQPWLANGQAMRHGCTQG